jgi:ppGpp synthetase/RelA/SpoT-type nucleotidyltranferase
MVPSKTSVDKAGAYLRSWRSNTLDRTDPEYGPKLLAAIQTVWEYRRQFQYPLTKVNANLRHYVKATDCEVLIAQRLKRLPRIIEKLHRQPRMRLSQMQDVGGCRAILPSERAVRNVLAGITRNWDLITVDDYITEPKKDGYRGVHAIVRRGGVPVEVQLRTFGEQDWADEVERMDGLVPYAMKDGEGPPEVRRYLNLLSDIIAASESGRSVPEEWVAELHTLGAHMP